MYQNPNYPDADVAMEGFQVTYSPNNAVVMHGYDDGRPSSPDADVVLEPEEKIVAVLGSSGSAVNSLAFLSQIGNGVDISDFKILGPWGGSGPVEFQIFGIPVGLFGGNLGPNLGAIGVYTLVEGRAKLPVVCGTGVGQGGIFKVTGWDDGPGFAGTLSCH